LIANAVAGVIAVRPADKSDFPQWAFHLANDRKNGNARAMTLAPAFCGGTNSKEGQ